MANPSKTKTFPTDRISKHLADTFLVLSNWISVYNNWLDSFSEQPNLKCSQTILNKIFKEVSVAHILIKNFKLIRVTSRFEMLCLPHILTSQYSHLLLVEVV